MGDEKSLAHTRWNCKYHIVFAPKYRRQAFYGEKRRAVGSILRKLCEWKNVRILEALPFRYPMKLDTLIFGGISRSM
ncbi:transposase for insertion sequence element IS200 [Salmonella enterica subsp. enterica serovar Typhi]|nr:transposase for insertion sequence element IS200 [Salmonella enterica subsp. enterica serovar Typhi]